MERLTFVLEAIDSPYVDVVMIDLIKQLLNQPHFNEVSRHKKIACIKYVLNDMSEAIVEKVRDALE